MTSRAMALRGVILLMILCLGIASIGEAPAAEPQGLRAGPAAWVEEYWEVKPEKFDEFVKVYRQEVYSLARQVPGYRGYTVLTNIPNPAAPSQPNLFGEKMFIPHYG